MFQYFDTPMAKQAPVMMGQNAMLPEFQNTQADLSQMPKYGQIKQAWGIGAGNPASEATASPSEGHMTPTAAPDTELAPRMLPNAGSVGTAAGTAVKGNGNGIFGA